MYMFFLVKRLHRFPYDPNNYILKYGILLLIVNH